MTMKNDPKLAGESTSQVKIDLRNLTRPVKNLENLNFIGLLLTKVYNVWAKKVQKSHVWWHRILVQNLEENWLGLSKITWGIWQIFTKALKSLKIGPPPCWDSFIQSRKCMSLNFTGELCVMIMKNDAKFGEELTCQFKTNMRNLTNFDPSTQKSKNFAL